MFLTRVLAQIREPDRQLFADLLAHRGADADLAGLGQRLDPGGDVDAVAEDVALVDDDVAEIDADAKADALVLRACWRYGPPSPAALRRRSARHRRPRRTRSASRHRCLDDASWCWSSADRSILADGLLRTASVLSSSAPMSREYPTTSAQRSAPRPDCRASFLFIPLPPRGVFIELARGRVRNG